MTSDLDLWADNSSRLHEPAFQVTFKVTNTGYVSGTEVRETCQFSRFYPCAQFRIDSSALYPPPIFRLRTSFGFEGIYKC
jgi:hypothetical protein